MITQQLNTEVRLVTRNEHLIDVALPHHCREEPVHSRRIENSVMVYGKLKAFVTGSTVVINYLIIHTEPL